MKEKKVPIIELNKEANQWLEEVYKYLKENKRPTERQIWSKLYGQLPINFSPIALDARLINASGEYLTMLGVIAIEKNYDIIKKANTLIYKIKETLIAHPEKKDISVSNIANECNMDTTEAGIILSLANQYGRFYRGASLTPDGIAITTMEIGDQSEYFQQYIYFSGIENLIIAYLEQEEKNKQNNFPTEQTTTNNYKRHFNIEPIFKSKIYNVNTGLCFVLMPFTEEWSDRVYNRLIKQNIEELGLQCIRADSLNGQIIIEDIWTQINQAAIIIADVTNKNANVMYELGIVHTVGRPTVLLTQNINNIPFDFTHLRHYEYKDNIESFEKFGIKLKSVIKEMHQDKYPNFKKFD